MQDAASSLPSGRALNEQEAPRSSLPQTDDSALPQGGVGGPTYYVRHPDDSYTVADPQPAALPTSASSDEGSVGDAPWTDAELPGMWELADFVGGQDEVRGPDWTPHPAMKEQK